MANPRDDVDFEGIGVRNVTHKHDNSIVYDEKQPGGSVAVGKAVKATGQRTVGLTTDGSDVVGKIIKVEDDGFATIQEEGGTTLPGGTGATLTPGSKIVGALNGGNPGFVRSVNSAVAAELAVAKHEIKDSTTPAATKVMLG